MPDQVRPEAPQEGTGAAPIADVPAPPKRLRGNGLNELFAMPDPEWLVGRHFHRGTLAVLYGEPGCMKTFYALDLALSVATGKPFAGKFATEQGSVLYIAGEGMSGLKKRAMAWIKAKNNGVVPTNFFLASARVDLTDVTSDDLKKLVVVIEQDIQVKPALIIIDTMARAFNGDENSAQDVGKFIRVTDMLREWLGSTVLVVHHTGKDAGRGARGSTALLGAADTMIALDKTKGGVKVSNTKQKDATEMKDYILYHTPVEVAPDAADECDRTSIVFNFQDDQTAREQFLAADVKHFREWSCTQVRAGQVQPRGHVSDPRPRGERDRKVAASEVCQKSCRSRSHQTPRGRDLHNRGVAPRSTPLERSRPHCYAPFCYDRKHYKSQHTKRSTRSTPLEGCYGATMLQKPHCYP